MQFRLVTMLGVITAFAVVCAMILASPPVGSLLLLATLLWLSPSAWITGIIYGRDRLRAFCIGGVIASAVPFIAAGIYSVVMVYELLYAGLRGMRYSMLSPYVHTDQTVIAALGLFAPILIAFLGGLVALAMRRYAVQNTVIARALQLNVRRHPLDDVSTPASDRAVATIRRADTPESADRS